MATGFFLFFLFAIDVFSSLFRLRHCFAAAFAFDDAIIAATTPLMLMLRFFADVCCLLITLHVFTLAFSSVTSHAILLLFDGQSLMPFRHAHAIFLRPPL